MIGRQRLGVREAAAAVDGTVAVAAVDRPRHIVDVGLELYRVPLGEQDRAGRLDGQCRAVAVAVPVPIAVPIAVAVPIASAAAAPAATAPAVLVRSRDQHQQQHPNAQRADSSHGTS
jgi:hypothetical protein